MKMLRVFSNQLRAIHRKTESILNSNADVDQPTGMLSVAQSFLEDEQYKACCDVCMKLCRAFRMRRIRKTPRDCIRIRNASSICKNNAAVTSAKLLRSKNRKRSCNCRSRGFKAVFASGLFAFCQNVRAGFGYYCRIRTGRQFLSYSVGVGSACKMRKRREKTWIFCARPNFR